MDRTSIGRGYFCEGQDAWIVSQVYLPTGALLTSSDYAGGAVATVSVYDLSSTTPATPIITAPTIALGNGTTGVVLNTPATSTVGWDLDTTGANFRLILYDTTATNLVGVNIFGGTVKATGGHRYQVEITFPTTSYGLAAILAEISCSELMSQ